MLEKHLNEFYLCVWYKYLWPIGGRVQHIWIYLKIYPKFGLIHAGGRNTLTNFILKKLVLKLLFLIARLPCSCCHTNNRGYFWFFRKARDRSGRKRVNYINIHLGICDGEIENLKKLYIKKSNSWPMTVYAISRTYDLFFCTSRSRLHLQVYQLLK